MNDDLIGITVTLAVLAVILPLVLTHATHKMRQIEDAWRKLAERHRLQFRPGRKLAVSGLLDGRAFEMKSVHAGNNTTYAMELSLEGPLPAGLRIKAHGKHKEHVEVLGAPLAEVDERTGRVDINEEARVSSADPGELPPYLDAGRRRAALRLADVGGELDGHTLRVAISKFADDLERLDESLHVLATVAPVFDTA